MSDYNAIADVGETLLELLRDNMEKLIPRESIVLASPGDIDVKDSVRLSLFLYQVLENVHLKNQEMQIADPAKLIFSPITLELYYMLTSYVYPGEQDKTEKTQEGHSLLGRAMQILYDHSTLKGSFLKGNLESDTELHVTISPISLDDITKIWTTFHDKPFRASVCYVVTPVRINSSRETNVQRVVSKEMNYFYMVPKKEG